MGRRPRRGAVGSSGTAERNRCRNGARTTRILGAVGGRADPCPDPDGRRGWSVRGGADVAELRERRRDEALAAINLTMFDRLQRSPLPTIAAIDGPALAGAARSSPATCESQAHARCSVSPSRGSASWPRAGGCFRLPELVGETLARELLFTGRRLTAEEALAARLVNRVVEPERLLAETHRVCDDIVRSSPLALRLTKLALNAPRSAHPAVELAAQAVLFDDPEKHARMTAFLERRR